MLDDHFFTAVTEMFQNWRLKRKQSIAENEKIADITFRKLHPQDSEEALFLAEPFIRASLPDRLSQVQIFFKA